MTVKPKSWSTHITGAIFMQKAYLQYVCGFLILIRVARYIICWSWAWPKLLSICYSHVERSLLYARGDEYSCIETCRQASRTVFQYVVMCACEFCSFQIVLRTSVWCRCLYVRVLFCAEIVENQCPVSLFVRASFVLIRECRELVSGVVCTCEFCSVQRLSRTSVCDSCR